LAKILRDLKPKATSHPYDIHKKAGGKRKEEIEYELNGTTVLRAISIQVCHDLTSCRLDVSFFMGRRKI